MHVKKLLGKPYLHPQLVREGEGIELRRTTRLAGGIHRALRVDSRDN
jgi:hypothetical protein